MKYAFPANYGEDCVLVPIDAALVPLVAGALRPFEQRYSWLTEEDYELGYNAFAELQANMSGRCLERLILEIRALRGGSFPAENWRDPEADPADIGLSTIGGVITETAAAVDKLEEIRALVAQLQDAETLDEIKASVAQIAILLA